MSAIHSKDPRESGRVIQVKGIHLHLFVHKSIIPKCTKNQLMDSLQLKGFEIFDIR